eukprot:jgi/Picsp_1/5560/NSC_02919-R1_protein executer chloroplastic-like
MTVWNRAKNMGRLRVALPQQLLSQGQPCVPCCGVLKPRKRVHYLPRCVSSASEGSNGNRKNRKRCSSYTRTKSKKQESEESSRSVTTVSSGNKVSQGGAGGSNLPGSSGLGRGELHDLGKNDINKELNRAEMKEVDRWGQWKEYFLSMDEVVRELNAVDEEIALAVKREDYGEAASLQEAQKKMEQMDSIISITNELEVAISEERYEDAASLRDAGGARLLGWWIGKEGEDDPQGHLILITKDFSRYVAHAYTGSMLARAIGWSSEFSGGSIVEDGILADILSQESGDIIDILEGSRDDEDEHGAPVFEVFYRKQEGTWEHQPVVLNSSAVSAAGSRDLDDLSAILSSQVGGMSNVISIEQGKDPDGTSFVRINLVDQRNDKTETENNPELIGEEPDDVSGDLNDTDDATINTVEDLVKSIDSFKLEDNEIEDSWVGESQGNEDLFTALSKIGSSMAQRVPAEITWTSKDSFTLCVDQNKQKEILEVTNLVSDLDMAGDGSDKVFTTLPISVGNGEGKGSPTLDEVESMVKEALLGASSKLNSNVAGLEGEVSYRRLKIPTVTTDIFQGIYIGSFGPHGPEVIQVERNLIDGKEWVYGVKLTGDNNVPAGQVSFKAQVGRDSKLSSSGVYPIEYGIQARYPGKGRVAREGYSSPKWVEGEFLALTKSNPITRGAELGFVFHVDSSKKFLLLFERIPFEFLD